MWWGTSPGTWTPRWGALYLVQEDGLLKLMGSYAYTRRKGLSNEFRVGEGLVGQAALEMKPIIINGVPDDCVRIQSGTGDATPHCILVAPFLYEGKVKGVLELGAVREFQDLQLEFLQQVLGARVPCPSLHRCPVRVGQRCLPGTAHRGHPLRGES